MSQPGDESHGPGRPVHGPKTRDAFRGIKKKWAKGLSFLFVRISDFRAGRKMQRLASRAGLIPSPPYKRALIFPQRGACPSTNAIPLLLAHNPLRAAPHPPPPLSPPPTLRPSVAFYSPFYIMHFTQARTPVHGGLPEKQTMPLVPAYNPRVGLTVDNRGYAGFLCPPPALISTRPCQKGERYRPTDNEIPEYEKPVRDSPRRK